MTRSQVLPEEREGDASNPKLKSGPNTFSDHEGFLRNVPGHRPVREKELYRRAGIRLLGHAG